MVGETGVKRVSSDINQDITGPVTLGLRKTMLSVLHEKVVRVLQDNVVSCLQETVIKGII